MEKAFLFDIDGCLTLPSEGKSYLDIDLFSRIFGFSNPVALVTGRSDGWLRQHYSKHNRSDLLDITTYIEFGLARIENREVVIQKNATTFLSIREDMINDLANIATDEDIYFEPEIWYNDYPNHGSLWVEDKHIQLSIAANSTISPSQVHNLVSKAWVSYLDKVRILYHHLGVDVIPKNWSKGNATADFISGLDETTYHWYVFGDNESDREMLTGLTNATFVSTLEHASQQVRSVLASLDML